MSSPIAKVKLQKLVAGDFEVQAAINDVVMNSELVANAARHARIASPMLDEALALYRKTVEIGRGDQDMAAVVFAIAQLTALNTAVSGRTAPADPATPSA
jgi:3-hydroxyisobutyrate dehydrogenase